VQVKWLCCSCGYRWRGRDPSDRIRRARCPRCGSFSVYPGTATEDWYEISDRIRKRDGYKCAICGSKKELEVHHIVPLSKGGTSREDNLITLCRRCHSKCHSSLGCLLVFVIVVAFVFGPLFLSGELLGIFLVSFFLLFFGLLVRWVIQKWRFEKEIKERVAEKGIKLWLDSKLSR